jgi:4-aminobutyrate aminotransferase-like enzyme
MEEDNLRENADVVGRYYRGKLEDLQQKHALIGEVRGMGLLQGIELVKDRTTKEPAPQETNRVMDEAKNRGLLIGKGGLYANVLRTSPPLNINKADVDEAIRILDEAFTAVESAR